MVAAAFLLFCLLAGFTGSGICFFGFSFGAFRTALRLDGVSASAGGVFPGFGRFALFFVSTHICFRVFVSGFQIILFLALLRSFFLLKSGKKAFLFGLGRLFFLVGFSLENALRLARGSQTDQEYKT